MERILSRPQFWDWRAVGISDVDVLLLGGRQAHVAKLTRGTNNNEEESHTILIL